MHEVMTQGFVFPNELHVAWSIMIALYPYITGLVAGAFIVSSLYHVFGDKDLKPVGNMALVAALCFIFYCMTPLLFHLGQPFRCFNIMFTPNLQSAMSIFGYICFFYMGVLLVEIWLVFRKDIIERSREGFILKRWFYALLALGITEFSDESLALDKKIVGFLAAIGIPAACVLHGYVGFIFGAIKSNPWWSTPLMPLIFLLSAIVSGIAMLILMYLFVMKVMKKAIDVPCIHALCKYFWGFLILAVTLEELQVLTMGYMAEESWGIVSVLLSEKLRFSYNWLQVYIGAFIPLVLLGIVALRPLKDSTKITFAALSSFLILVQVFAMRWNVVIGGQLFSKSLRGFTDYDLPFFGREGVLVALIIFSLPFITFFVCTLILPVFKDQEKTEPSG